MIEVLRCSDAVTRLGTGRRTRAAASRAIRGLHANGGQQHHFELK